MSNNDNYYSFDEINQAVLGYKTATAQWLLLTEVEKRLFIDFAEDVIDNKFDYIGQRLVPSQLKAFPRNFDEYIENPANQFNKLVYNNRTLPNELKLAIVYIIDEVLQVDAFRQVITLQDAVNATRVKVSNIELEMEGRGNKYIEAEKVLSPYLKVHYSFRVF